MTKRQPQPVAGLPADYATLLSDIKARVQAARIKAGMAANRELLALHWDIGRMILDRQEKEGWGAKVIDRLSVDLQKAFPGRQGFSPRNLKYMRTFTDTWTAKAIVQAPLAQLPWYHHIALLDKLGSSQDRLWYAAKAVEKGWSRDVLALQIESGLQGRQGKAVTNLKRHCRRYSPTSPRASRKTHISSTSSRYATMPMSARLRRASSGTWKTSCWNWAPGFPLWGGRCILMWEIRTSTWTFSFII